jgi:aminoglycoside 6'-N-acetyltransferase
MSMTMQTARLLLRPFHESDLEPFLAYRSDPQVAEYQGWPMPYTREMAANFIAEMRSTRPNIPGEWYQMAIEVKETGEMIGDLAYYLLKEDQRQAEIGITLASTYHGRGYGVEAAERLLAYLFDELKLHRVRANCDVENPPAWKTLERLGFRREAHFVENLWFRGRWASEYWYGMLDREWGERRRA